MIEIDLPNSFRNTSAHNSSNSWFDDVVKVVEDVGDDATDGPVLIVVMFFASILSELLARIYTKIKEKPRFKTGIPILTTVIHNSVCTGVHSGKTTLNSLIMAAFLTMDIYIILAIVGGTAIGQLVFNWDIPDIDFSLDLSKDFPSNLSIDLDIFKSSDHASGSGCSHNNIPGGSTDHAVELHYRRSPPSVQLEDAPSEASQQSFLNSSTVVPLNKIVLPTLKTVSVQHGISWGEHPTPTFLGNSVAEVHNISAAKSSVSIGQDAKIRKGPNPNLVRGSKHSIKTGPNPGFKTGPSKANQTGPNPELATGPLQAQKSRTIALSKTGENSPRQLGPNPDLRRGPAATIRMPFSNTVSEDGSTKLRTSPAFPNDLEPIVDQQSASPPEMDDIVPDHLTKTKYYAKRHKKGKPSQKIRKNLNFRSNYRPKILGKNAVSPWDNSFTGRKLSPENSTFSLNLNKSEKVNSSDSAPTHLTGGEQTVYTSTAPVQDDISDFTPQELISDSPRSIPQLSSIYPTSSAANDNSINRQPESNLQSYHLAKSASGITLQSSWQVPNDGSTSLQSSSANVGHQPDADQSHFQTENFIPHNEVQNQTLKNSKVSTGNTIDTQLSDKNTLNGPTKPSSSVFGHIT